MKKTLRNDLILIGVLLTLILGGLFTVLLTRKKDNLIAKIYVKNELVQTIDLSKEKDREFEIEGAKGKLTISIKNNHIGVIESECPHQDCVHTGFVNESNRPIICAYNQVYIIIEGDSSYDARIGQWKFKKSHY